jgi:hypothetical protein
MAASAWPVHTERRGWLPGEVSKASLMHMLAGAEIDALQAVTARIAAAGTPLTRIVRDQFRHPLLDPLLVRLSHELRWGAGLTLIGGVPLERFTLDELRILYWGIAAWFGRAESQNIDGELMGEVRVRPTKIAYRAYSIPGPLPFHSDRIDILTLFCIRKALSGGANQFVSSLAVYERLKREAPQHLPILERGFYFHRNGEQAPGDPAPTPYRIPVFARQDGLLSCLFSANALVSHQKEFFADLLTADEEAALVALRAVIDDPVMHIRVQLEPGEMVFINNYEVAHSREDFTDAEQEDRKRFLLRLWLSGTPWRPKVPGMTVVRNPSGRQGIDAHPMAA